MTARAPQASCEQHIQTDSMPGHHAAAAPTTPDDLSLAQQLGHLGRIDQRRSAQRIAAEHPCAPWPPRAVAGGLSIKRGRSTGGGWEWAGVVGVKL